MVGLAVGIPVLIIVTVCCVRRRRRQSDYLHDRARLRPRDALNKPNMQIVSPGHNATPLQLDRAKVPGNIGLSFMSGTTSGIVRPGSATGSTGTEADRRMAGVLNRNIGRNLHAANAVHSPVGAPLPSPSA